MAWFSGKVSLGGFPDITGAVNKFQESVKNMEKNFDNALGFDEKSESGGAGGALLTFSYLLRTMYNIIGDRNNLQFERIYTLHFILGMKTRCLDPFV